MSLNDNISAMFGKAPFGVKITENEKLQGLLDQARGCRDLPFQEKLEKIKEIAVGAMRNAFDLKESNPDVFKDIVMTPHTLAEALEKNAGCCRYQATLFFILGLEAELGDEHLLRSAEIGGHVNTCFNTVIKDGETLDVSIFCESLKEKKFDYTEGSKPDVDARLKDHIQFFKGFPIRGFVIQVQDREIPYHPSYGEAFYSYTREEGRFNCITTMNHERVRALKKS